MWTLFEDGPAFEATSMMAARRDTEMRLLIIGGTVRLVLLDTTYEQRPVRHLYSTILPDAHLIYSKDGQWICLQRIYDPWLPAQIATTAAVYRVSPHRHILVNEPDEFAEHFVQCSRSRFYQGCVDDMLDATELEPLVDVTVSVPLSDSSGILN